VDEEGRLAHREQPRPGTPVLESHEIAVVRALETDYSTAESCRRILDDKITFGRHFRRHALLFAGMTRKNVTVSVATAHAGSR
ncbi:hypothetical protein QV65_16140, partial [Rhodococcus erythropolis]